MANKEWISFDEWQALKKWQDEQEHLAILFYLYGKTAMDSESRFQDSLSEFIPSMTPPEVKELEEYTWKIDTTPLL